MLVVIPCPKEVFLLDAVAMAVSTAMRQVLPHLARDGLRLVRKFPELMGAKGGIGI